TLARLEPGLSVVGVRAAGCRVAARPAAVASRRPRRRGRCFEPGVWVVGIGAWSALRLPLSLTPYAYAYAYVLSASRACRRRRAGASARASRTRCRARPRAR